MSALRALLRRRLTPESTDVRVAQALCFLAAPALLILTLRATARFASTPGEVLTNVLGGGALALLVVILGLVLPTPPAKDS